MSDTLAVCDRSLLWLAAISSSFMGVVGMDRMYMGQPGLAVLKFFTLGGFGLLSLADEVAVVWAVLKSGKLGMTDSPSTLNNLNMGLGGDVKTLSTNYPGLTKFLSFLSICKLVLIAWGIYSSVNSITSATNDAPVHEPDSRESEQSDSRGHVVGSESDIDSDSD